MKNNKIIRSHSILNVYHFCKHYIHIFLFSELCLIVIYIVSILLPLNLIKLTDNVLTAGKYNLLGEVAISYILLFAFSSLANLGYAYSWQTLNNRYLVDIKNTMFKRIIFAKSSVLTKMNSGDFIDRIDNNSIQMLNIVQRNMFHLLNSLILMASVIYMIYKINHIISWIIIASVLIPIMFVGLAAQMIDICVSKSNKIKGALNGDLFEILKGMYLIKLLSAEWWADRKVVKSLHTLIKLANKYKRIEFSIGKIGELASLAANLVIYGYSAKLIIEHRLTVGTFLALLQYLALLNKKFVWSFKIATDLFAKSSALKRTDYILNLPQEQNDGEPFDEDIYFIEFINVSFAYGENKVLEDVSFSINRGEHIGLVGFSGVGKTTIIGILLKFYEPQTGEVLINGRKLSQINSTDLRRKIGVVQQDILLFDESIRNNLVLDGGEYTDEELLSACKKVGLYEFIKSLPDGLDTPISFSKQGLSGGQKQRIMIARVILKGAKTIILDEATSAVDVQTEEQIINNISFIDNNAIILVISHRLNSIKGCDKILVLNDGKITETGSHYELLDTSENYRRMFEACLNEA